MKVGGVVWAAAVFEPLRKSRIDEGRHELPAAALVCSVYVIAALLARTIGTGSVSDDDFARTTIAQSFSHHPRLDPTGTSWLPAPFWLNGVWMIALGPSLDTARWAALLGAAISALLLYVSARWIGASTWRAALASLLPLGIPLVPVLAGAMVPELPTSALITLALCSLVAPTRTRLVVGACSLVVATLSRYESWFVAMYFSIACMCIVARSSRKNARHVSWAVASISASIALSGPVCWMAWNAHAHGDALRFVQRVTSFRNAVSPASTLALLFDYPLAAMVEGGAILVLAVLVASTRAHRWRRLRALAPAWVGSLVLVLALSVAEVRGGAPTHHPERAISSLWLLCAVSCSTWRSSNRSRVALAFVGVAALLVGQTYWRGRTTLDGLADRSNAIRSGVEIARSLRADERCLLVARSYDHFATISAIARPWDVEVIVPEGFDPRSHDRDPLTSVDGLRQAMIDRRATVFVARGDQRDRVRPWLAELGGSTIELSSGDTLFRLENSRR